MGSTLRLFTLATLAAAAGATGCGHESGLRRWLCELTFNVPPIILTEGGVTISFEQTSCTGVQLGTLSSSILHKYGEALVVSADGVAFGCTVGNVSVSSAAKWIEGSGSANISVAGASLQLGVELRTDVDQLIDGAALTSECWLSLLKDRCTRLELPHLDVKLDGSGLVSIVSVLLPLVTGTIRSLLPGQIISVLQDLVDLDATAALRRLDASLRPLLAPVQPQPEPSLSAAETIDWRRSDALTLADFALNDVIGADGPLCLNGVARALSGGSGRLELNTSLALPPLRLGGVGELNVSVARLEVGGLDTFDTVELLAPLASDADAHSLDTKVGLDQLEIAAGLRLEFVTTGASVVDAPLALELDVRTSLAHGARAPALHACTCVRPLPARVHVRTPSRCSCARVFEGGLRVCTCVRMRRPTFRRGWLGGGEESVGRNHSLGGLARLVSLSVRGRPTLSEAAPLCD